MIRLADKLHMLADARFRLLMERRKAEGKSVANPATTRAVVSALINRTDQDGTCYPYIETIAEESDAGVRTVQRVCDILRDEGIISVAVRSQMAGTSKRELGSTNLYKIDWEAFAELREGGALTGASTASVPKENGRQDGARSQTVPEKNGRQSGARTDASLAPERAPATTGTGASLAQNGRQSGACSNKRIARGAPPNEPLKGTTPPTPPRGAGEFQLPDKGGGVLDPEAEDPLLAAGIDDDEAAALIRRAAAGYNRQLRDGEIKQLLEACGFGESTASEINRFIKPVRILDIVRALVKLIDDPKARPIQNFNAVFRSYLAKDGNINESHLRPAAVRLNRNDFTQLLLSLQPRQTRRRRQPAQPRRVTG